MTDKQADEMGHKVRQMLDAIDRKDNTGKVVGFAGEISRMCGVAIMDVLMMAELIHELPTVTTL